MTGRAGIIGIGLIGGSIGLRLRELGWHVVGSDRETSVEAAALEVGAIDEVGSMAGTDICFVCTPASSVAELVKRALDEGAAVVTDVGSVKGEISQAVNDPRFVPGHPMAGSEQDGIGGARSTLFNGAVWVLTPTPTTSDDAYAKVRSVVQSLGPDVVDVDAHQHDGLVAMVSHVPHLTAVTLMAMADRRSTQDTPLLRLAAGGFRDMTRIAAGSPTIWPDICEQNADAITAVLDELIGSLGSMRDIVAQGDTNLLVAELQGARKARLNLPSSVPHDEDLTEVRVPVLDQPGELALITRLATDIDCNIYDLEIRHSSEGQKGVIILLVGSNRAERLLGALMAQDYRPSLRKLA